MKNFLRIFGCACVNTYKSLMKTDGGASFIIIFSGFVYFLIPFGGVASFILTSLVNKKDRNWKYYILVYGSIIASIPAIFFGDWNISMWNQEMSCEIGTMPIPGPLLELMIMFANLILLATIIGLSSIILMFVKQFEECKEKFESDS